MANKKNEALLSGPSSYQDESTLLFEAEITAPQLKLVGSRSGEDRQADGSQAGRFSSDLIKSLIDCIKKV